MSTRYTLSREDPRVDGIKIVCYGNFDLRCSSIGIIRKYWFQYKKTTVILAYLQKVHRLSVGYVMVSWF